MEGLMSLLAPSEFITSQSDANTYEELTSFWAAQNNLRPYAVVAPSDVQTLGKVLQYLYNDTQLDFAFRGHGYTSMAAKDVLVSMHKFDSFSYNAEQKTVTVGAGQRWLDVYESVNKVASQFTLVGARTPCVSVGGSIVTGGFSWLSGDFGCISDPENMLDCEIAKYDGSTIWASQEPQLLWAIRGGGGGLGGISFFMFIEKGKFQNMHDVDVEDQDALVFHVFDASGEVHGRQTFKWALDLPGAQDFTKTGTFLETIRMQNASAEEEQNAKDLAQQAPKLLMGNDPSVTPTPNAIEEWTDISKIYGNHLAKLQALRARYDPKARFKAHVPIA
ncbi:FAD-binding domain-containing protein [Colletotrichum sp. SAR 10_98]|nr:FAD-binding domain-containing protein [Colletotrichum sp. SAR 10_98]